MFFLLFLIFTLSLIVLRFIILNVMLIMWGKLVYALLQESTSMFQLVLDGVRSTRVIQSVLDSAIGQHLIENPTCSGQYQEKWFQIVDRVQSQHLLKIIEAVNIKLRKATLCRQNESFIYFLLLEHFFSLSPDPFLLSCSSLFNNFILFYLYKYN